MKRTFISIGAGALLVVSAGTAHVPDIFPVTALSGPVTETRGFLTIVRDRIEAASSDEVTLLFGGDMMFDRHIRKKMEQHGPDQVFSCIIDVLKGADVVIANLEGPITGEASRSMGTAPPDPNNYVFTFPLYTADLLARSGIDLVNLGNNHIENFGERGVQRTIESLNRAGVSFFGDPYRERTVDVAADRMIFTFISYNEFGGSSDTVISDIKRARLRGTLPVVYTHWGDEYTEPPPRVVERARAFVDAGAVLIVGSHPHVVQRYEYYRGVPIFYSLGNFIFDQYFSEEVKHGMLVQVVFSDKKIKSIDTIPVGLFPDGRTCPMS